MSYDVQIIADSIGAYSPARITTFQLRYPRMIHAELMTHRMFSRNASSTRAIPTAKMIEWIERDPAMPVYWGKNQKGMQATQELSETEVSHAKSAWLEARDKAIEFAEHLMSIGVHKQIASRILEPWAHINVIVTATSFDNFFALRCHRAAMPEIQVLAVKMARAYEDSIPYFRSTDGDDHEAWHLPYVSEEERSLYPIGTLLKLSTARCARVSYLTFEGKEPNHDSDVALHDSLSLNGHWSPFEHPAQTQPQHSTAIRSGNFLDWIQYRQTLPKSVHSKFDFNTLDAFGDRDFIV